MITFKNLTFVTEDNKIFLTSLGNLKNLHSGIAQVQVTGGNKITDMGTKMVNSSEGLKLEYCSHRVDGNVLTICQKTDLVEVITEFTAFDDTNALRVKTKVKNISSEAIVLEEVSAFVVTGIPFNSEFTRFLQGHHKECQPMTRTLAEWGLDDLDPNGQRSIAFANVGSWSTKAELPQGIVTCDAGQMMFQIESSSSWYYELSDVYGEYYLYLGGPNLTYCGWACELKPGEEYTTPAIALAFGEDLNDVIKNMTLYRRHFCKNYAPDQNLPSIFNEYMHFSWDSPKAERTHMMAEIVAKAGIEYYVIDCGWHNEEPGERIYPFVGQWKESKARFPEGVGKTLDYIRSLGMKPGLWIEPEIIGCQCTDMLEYYEDDCFFQRFGRRLAIMNRHFLDYRNPKVREYMTETMRRMIEDYGAAYVKFDYNQDCAVGTDLNALTPGKGLEDAIAGFFEWVEEMHQRFPDVVFEGCSSGGMRMDPHSLSAFSLYSTSDQYHYDRYPCIAANILSAVIPEQAAVWTYPVTDECTGPDVSFDRIGVNMVNSLLGRMHLASHLDRLNEEQIALISEGIAYYNSLTPMKKRALPYFPNGFTHFGEKKVCAGLRDGNKIYLAVWNLGEADQVYANVPGVKSVKIAYPSSSDATVTVEAERICVDFPRKCMAAFLEIEL